jgi:dCTP deaminase
MKMAFWRSETMRTRIPVDQLVDPYFDEHVTCGAYELGMGAEAFITSTADKVKIQLDDRESFVIPPGQLALLLTEERIKVPLNSIAFISMKFGVKRRGLINVSGFHVDPGFEGHLKFSVYNAGSNPITVTRGDRLFLIWYANLDGETSDG